MTGSAAGTDGLTPEVGLLKTIVENLERTPIPVDPRAAGFWREQGIELEAGTPRRRASQPPFPSPDNMNGQVLKK
jgi:hypothetical protein